MTRVAAILLVLALLPATVTAASAKTPLIPRQEWRMIRQVAVNYGLTDEQTWLLAAIRRLENGRPGLEFGVGGPMDSGHPAHRYRDGYKSFLVQASWAAGTIRKHDDGDVSRFGRRFCPLNAANWSARIRSLIARLKAEGGTLPGVKPRKKIPLEALFVRPALLWVR